MMKNLTYLKISGFWCLSVPNLIGRKDALTLGNPLIGTDFKEELPLMVPNIGPNTLIEFSVHSSADAIEIDVGVIMYKESVSYTLHTHLKHPVHI